MTPARFDPDARAEFLAAIEYYEECRPGLDDNFDLPLNPQFRISVRCLFVIEF